MLLACGESGRLKAIGSGPSAGHSDAGGRARKKNGTALGEARDGGSGDEGTRLVALTGITRGSFGRLLELSRDLKLREWHKNVGRGAPTLALRDALSVIRRETWRANHKLIERLTSRRPARVDLDALVCRTGRRELCSRLIADSTKAEASVKRSERWRAQRANPGRKPREGYPGPGFAISASRQKPYCSRCKFKIFILWPLLLSRLVGCRTLAPPALRARYRSNILLRRSSVCDTSTSLFNIPRSIHRSLSGHTVCRSAGYRERRRAANLTGWHSGSITRRYLSCLRRRGRAAAASSYVKALTIINVGSNKPGRGLVLKGEHRPGWNS